MTKGAASYIMETQFAECTLQDSDKIFFTNTHTHTHTMKNNHTIKSIHPETRYRHELTL